MRIGFIGLGAMGQGIVPRLIDARMLVEIEADAYVGS